MFHIHIEGAINVSWLSGYDGCERSNKIMGEWYGLYKRDIKIYILFINHPVHPV